MLQMSYIDSPRPIPGGCCSRLRIGLFAFFAKWHSCSRNGSVCTDYAAYTLEFDVTGGSTSIGRISFELGNIADGGTGQLAVDVDDIVLTNNGTVSAP
ncbi:hypothetical protein D3C73_1375080 [compost metagenome]